MELENAFEVAAPADRVWDFLLDLERVTPCMPGAELEELVDGRTWKGNVAMKLGAVSLKYATTVVIDKRDEAGRSVVLKAKARETRGKGTANATIRSSVEPTGSGGAHVAMHTDLTVTGAVAQYGRGMLADVSQRLTGEFAQCLESRLSAPEGAEIEPAAAKPIAGLRLGGWALARALGRLLARIWRAITSPFRRREEP